MRWPHADRGWVSPDEFIPLAEPSDIILDIGALAIKSAVAAASQWISSHPKDPPPS